MLTLPPKSKSSFLTFSDDNEVIFCKIVWDSRIARANPTIFRDKRRKVVPGV
jgi:hypothetical protein